MLRKLTYALSALCLLGGGLLFTVAQMGWVKRVPSGGISASLTESVEPSMTAMVSGLVLVLAGLVLFLLARLRRGESSRAPAP